MMDLSEKYEQLRDFTEMEEKCHPVTFTETHEVIIRMAT